MANIIVTLFTFILLVTQKILLLNEESLILLCFIVFVFLGINNLSLSFSNSLHNQSAQVEKNLAYSLKAIKNAFKSYFFLSKNFKCLLIKFEEFKNYYKNLILTLGNLITNYTKHQLVLTYTKKLSFLNKVEEQTIKLLVAIIVKRLGFIIKTKYFYNSSIKVTHFLSLNAILIRECIQLITLEKN